MHSRTTTFTVIAVISLILAGLGTIMTLITLPGMVVQTSMPAMPAGGPAVPAKLFMDIQAVQAKWLPFSWLLIVLKTIVIGMLYLGAIFALILKPGARNWLLRASVTGIVLEILTFGITTLMTFEMYDVMFRPGAMPGLPPGASGMASFAKGTAVAIGLVFFLVKGGFYTWVAVHLSGREERELYVTEEYDDDEYDDELA